MTRAATDSLWLPLETELDRWSAAGRRVSLWLRDDDAIAASPALDRLSALSQRHGLLVLLAVIPMLAEPSLAAALRQMPTLLPCQHGGWHRNHAPAGAKKTEFGADRAANDIRDELREAKARLGDLLGPALLPVFVPPWNRIDPAHAALLPDIGFRGLSCFRGYRLGAKGGPALVNTALDIMDWSARIGRPAADLVDEACRLLAGLRAEAGDGAALGLLLHHRDHDEAAWAFLEGFLARATAHPAVAHGDPRRLFGL
ncbi:polysaccharide deacetylase family protein [Bosea sp. (in: a-proteobacteria)]|uniref:polysaccharide deacetylase family protein n=1 Tax=Bosea sp. (in: a-proteobacteria) TaxID=1871050 RepID=UPI003F6F32D5